MEPFSQNLPVIRALAQAFNGDLAQLRLLHQGEGLVFETVCSGRPVILKTIASPVSIAGTLQARLNWIHYLQENGLRVPVILASREGRLVEEMPVEGGFYAGYASLKVPLSKENEITWMEEGLPFQLGAVIGRMHSLAKGYRLPAEPAPLGHWDGGDWLCTPEQVIHPSQEPVIAAIRHLREQIAQFPRTAQNYGLIHDDLHTGNVYKLDGQLLILDFDLLHQSWFAADIASALLFRVWIGPEKEKPELRQAAACFLHDLMDGYRTQETPPSGWEEMLPAFLKLREISLFQSFFRAVSVAQGRQDPFFAYVYESIARDRPFFYPPLPSSA